MRLGNPRPPHPIPPRGVFHPGMGMRSRELLAVTPNPAQLTVQGNESMYRNINIVFILVCLWEMQWSNGECAGSQIEHSGFEPWAGHCVVFLGKTLYSHCASLHLGV